MKRSVSIILICAFLLLSVFGCGGNKSVNSDTGSNEPNDTSSDSVSDNVKYSTWLADGMEKLRGDTKIPKDAVNEIDLYMAKREKHSFQIAIRADHNVEGLKVVIEEGERDDISVELFEEYLIETARRYYPDPIVPITDTFGVEKNMTECVLVRFTTTENTESGKHVYRFSLVDSKGNNVGTYTANVNVWDFSLPQNYSTDTSVGLYLDYIRSKEKIPGRLNVSYYIAYYEMLLDYGLSAYELPYDILNERADEYMSDPRVSSFKVDHNLSDETIIEYYNKLKTNPVWLEKAYFLPFDEPSTVADIDKLIPLCERLKELAPDIRIIIPFFTNVKYDSDSDEIDMLDKYLGIWCPKAPCWESKWLSDPLGKGYFGDRMDAQKAEGDKLWWYVCWEPGAPFCNMYVNEQGINHVKLFWQQYKYGVNGFLYWAANYWKYVEDPWTDMATVQGWLSSTVFGDGSLMYPGRNVGIEGPVASLRLECIRNGIEDIELLKLAEGLLGREWVDSKVAMVSTSLTVHTDSVDTFNEVRKAIGDAIAEAIKNNQ